MSAQFDLFSPPAPLQSLWDDLEGDPADDPDGLRYYQRDAYNAIMARFREGAKSLLLVMATGTGKAQPNSAKVLTPTGWTTMGALRAGDEVIGSDGRPTRVTGTFPQGSLPVARVTFTDGATTRCCEEHLWAARTKSQASRGADYSIRRAGALARDIRDGSGAVKWFAPVVSPVQFREQCLPVDPWLLGALIGDGCLRKGVRISTVDSHITDRIGALGFALRFLGGCDYSIVQGLVGRNGGPLTNALKSCGAYGFLAHEKRIPALYLVASHAQRLELLRGLMDTDGYCDGKGAEITTSSRGLALDIVELVRSLGGTSKARHRTTTRRDAWRVRVNTPDNPFSMPRKACHYQPNGRAVRSRAFKAIAADGREECTCISVESPDCLYVTDDYILTHNTETFGTVAKHWDGDVLVLAHRDELVEQAVKRLERMTGEYVEIEKAEWTSSPRTRLVVGSVQSFNKKRLERLGKNRFGLVIADECHHFLAPSYRRSLEWFDCPRLGVTATPDRGDEAALGQIFEDLAYVLDIEEAVDIGYLVPVKGRQVTLSEIHLENVGKSAGDFTIGELDQEMLKAVEGIVHETLRLEPNRPAVAFFPGVRSAEVAAQKFNLMRPDSAAFISGELRQQDPELVRRIVRNFKEGRLQYLCNCMIATEGFDAPPAALIVQGRPTLSRALYAQMVGRGTRSLPGTVDKLPGVHNATARKHAIASSKKPDCMILDFVGNSTKHSLMTIEDVLGGKYSDEEVTLAKKKRAESGEAKDGRQALIEARRELEALAKATRAKVKAVVRDFDPFAVFGMSLDDEQRYSSRFGLKPASDKQLAVLRKFHMPEEDLISISKTAASRLIDKIKGRNKAGLANYQQMRHLQQWGITSQEVLYERANEAITYLSQTGFGKRAPVDPAKLQSILFRQRDGGDT